MNRLAVAVQATEGVSAVAAASVPAFIGLLGVVVGVLLTSWFERRRAASQRYDAALEALAEQQSARWGVGLGIPPEYTKSVTPDEQRTIERDLSVASVRAFLDAAALTRARLAALHPYSPDLRRYWDRLEVGEREFEDLAQLLAERRRRPLKRYG